MTARARVHDKRRAPSYRLDVARMLDAVADKVAAQDAEFVSARLKALPAHWSAYVAAEHERMGGAARADANRMLLDVSEGARGRLKLSSSDDDVRRVSADLAREAASAARHVAAMSQGAQYDYLERFCRGYGIEPAKVGASGFGPVIRRMVCGRWWLRRMRAAQSRRCEGLAIRFSMVRRGLWPYASNDCVVRRRQQQDRLAATVREACLVDIDAGEILPLEGAVKSSVANPDNRAAEMMVRVRGLDELRMMHEGMACEFWTITAPSRFHAQRIVGGCSEANPRFAGESPKDAARHLAGVWALARSAWARRGLRVFGLRTAEPHHDGCPHWHVVAYGDRAGLRHARRLLAVYAMREDSGELSSRAARRARFRAFELKGGEAGARYAAKYISKNVNGVGMEGARDKETGKKITSSVLRVQAWAAAWRIRQFQFFGTARVTVWRVLRRFREAVAVPGSALERARQCADASDWCGFTVACWGSDLELVKRRRDTLTEYGDAAAPVVVGVMEGGRRALLPERNLVIAWSKRAARRALENARGVSNRGGFGVPRSGVNNCTALPLLALQGVVDLWESRGKDSIQGDFALPF